MKKYKQKYYCQGMSFYGDKINLPYYENQTEKTIFLGLYFDNDYNVYNNHLGFKDIFWNGSDVLRLLNNEKYIEIIDKNKKWTNHFCHNEQLSKELMTIGIQASIVPLFFGYKNQYKTSFVGSQNPEVFINAHPSREKEYGVDIVLELAKHFKNYKFHIYGITGQRLENVIYHGWVSEKIMNQEIKKFQGCLRFNTHDGLSQILIKAWLYGMYTLQSRNIKKIYDFLDKLKTYKLPKKYDLNYIEDLNWFNK